MPARAWLALPSHPQYAAFGDRFLREARERFGDLPAEDLARRAEHLRKAYYARLALRSAQVRRKRAGAADDREVT
jgi:hypothetical protein